MKVKDKVVSVVKMLIKIRDHGKCYLIDGRVRSKETNKIVKMRKVTFEKMITDELVEVRDDGRVVITPCGYNAIRDNRLVNEANARYVTKMKTRGYRRRTVWVHQDEVEKFNEWFQANFK